MCARVRVTYVFLLFTHYFIAFLFNFYWDWDEKEEKANKNITLKPSQFFDIWDELGRILSLTFIYLNLL